MLSLTAPVMETLRARLPSIFRLSGRHRNSLRALHPGLSRYILIRCARSGIPRPYAPRPGATGDGYLANEDIAEMFTRVDGLDHAAVVLEFESWG